VVRDPRSSASHVICGEETRRGKPGGRNTPSHGRRDGGSVSEALKVLIAYELVVCRWMMFGIIICTICFTRGPIKIELVLGKNTILEPMIAHVKGFGFLETNLCMENAVSSSGVVGFKWSASERLFVAHFLKSSADRYSVLGIEKECSNFGFRGGSSNAAERFAKNIMNGTVWRWIWRRADGRRESGEEEMASSATASIGEDQIGSIGANSEHHVAGVIVDCCIRMRGKEVVKKHIAGSLVFFCRSGLVVGDFVEGRGDDRGITPARVVQEKA
jgi:hypothetical protein